MSRVRILPAPPIESHPRLRAIRGVVAEGYGRSMRARRLLDPRGMVLRVMAPQTRRERMRGLRGRPMLAVDQALLLESTRSIHTFGMRFPIAAVRLDRDLIVRSVQRVRPGRLLLPGLGIRHVLECAEDVDLRPGDRLRIIRGS